MENRLPAFLGPTKYERAEVQRYRAQRKLRRERCNAVITNILAGGKKLTLPKIQKLQHVGAITGATRRKKLLETSARARHEAADTEDWHPERQWHCFPVSVVEETTGAMQATSADHAEANVAREA